VVTAAVLAAALFWTGLKVYRRSLEKQIAAFELERAAIIQQLPDIRAAAAASKRLDSEPDWEELFRLLTHQLPSEIYLTELGIDDRRVFIRGRVRKAGRSTEEVLGQLMQRLGEGSMTEVSLRSSRQLEQATDLADFEIGGRLR